jgi:hypothetical protein
MSPKSACHSCFVAGNNHAPLAPPLCCWQCITRPSHPDYAAGNVSHAPRNLLRCWQCIMRRTHPCFVATLAPLLCCRQCITRLAISCLAAGTVSRTPPPLLRCRQCIMQPARPCRGFAAGNVSRTCSTPASLLAMYHILLALLLRAKHHSPLAPLPLLRCWQCITRPSQAHTASYYRNR